MIPNIMLPFANHLWQSTLFVIVIWLIVSMLRKNRAAVRHSLWLAASVKFLVPFSLLAGIGSQFQWRAPSVTPPLAVSMIVETISEPFASSPSPVPLGSTVPLDATPAPQPRRLSAVLITVWICGVVASFSWWFMRWRQVRRMVRRATPANFNGPLRVLNGPEHFEPGVFGILRPVLLMPEGIARRLSPAQLQAVLAHELCHVRRRDNLTSAIHMTVEALFWFHPFLWWIKSRLIDEQERACDEEVVRLGSEPMVYAESLLKVCEFYVESPLTCVSGVTGSDLKERVGRIMRNQTGETLNRWRKAALITIGVAALATPIVVGMVSASPIQAQTSQTRIRPQASRVAVIEGEGRAEAPISRLQQPTPASAAAKPLEFEVFKFRPADERIFPQNVLECRGVDGVWSFRSDLKLSGNSAPPLDSARSTVPRGRCVGLAHLRVYLSTAYDVRDGLISGAEEWLYHLDAIAENPATAKLEELRQMLRNLVVAEFKPKVSRETKEVPGYFLNQSKSGVKFKEVSGEEDFFKLGSAPPSLQGWDGVVFQGPYRMNRLANFLSWGTAGGPVLDKTGLSGIYDITLTLHHVLSNVGGPRGSGPAPEFDPPLAKALEQQLGLQLEPVKVPVDYLVVQSVERPKER